MSYLQKLKESLVAEGMVSEAQWEKCVSLQKENGKRIDLLLAEEASVPEAVILKMLASVAGIEYIDTIGTGEIDTAAELPVEFMKNNLCVPLKDKSGGPLIALSDPLGLEVLNEVGAMLRTSPRIAAAPPEEVLRAVEEYSSAKEEAAERVIDRMNGTRIEIAQELTDEPEDLLDLANKAPVIKLVNLILFQALKKGASDIHIQPLEREMKVRYRIDGVLQDVLTPPKKYDAAITSRIKIMANLNIAERRLPQDGRATIKFENRSIDLRVSIIPTSFGERVVIRLLDKENLFLGLEELGLPAGRLDLMNRLINVSHGIIMVTGPTGGGKTTTLYASLSRINSPDKNIITIEDPIEYQLPGISQIQVKPQIGLTFASGLRHIVRQDPDVVMVGEIRDTETAEIAIHASLTGHLVFSTLHTNDSCGAITRLLDMGIEAYLISSSMVAVIAQRLVRTLCRECRQECVPDARLLAEIGIEEGKPGKYFRGAGCEKCMGTGYRGRTGIYEMLVMDDDIRKLVLERSDTSSIKKKALEKGMVTLVADGADKVLRGLTTVEEVLRITRES